MAKPALTPALSQREREKIGSLSLWERVRVRVCSAEGNDPGDGPGPVHFGTGREHS
jgi:hypothetical protein